MQVVYTSPGGKVSITAEIGTEKEAFAFIGRCQDMFEESCCGECSSKSLRLDRRTVGKDTYYECKCRNCGARLDYGQTREGDQLYPKRKDAEGDQIGKNGWYVFNPTSA